MQLTRQKLRRIINEEKQKLDEGINRAGEERFYVVAVKNENGEISVIRDVNKGIFATTITRAETFVSERDAREALDQLRQSRVPTGDAYVAKVTTRLERL